MRTHFDADSPAFTPSSPSSNIRRITFFARSEKADSYFARYARFAAMNFTATTNPSIASVSTGMKNAAQFVQSSKRDASLISS